MTPADTCRANGWAVGTLLAGDEGYGETVIRITAIGESELLAIPVSHKGKPPSWTTRENQWTLALRDWRVVTEAAP